jgi:DNA-binding protein Fis
MNPEHFPTSGDADTQNLPARKLRNTDNTVLLDDFLALFPEFFVSAQNVCVYDLLVELLEKRLLVRILSKNQGDRRRTAEYLEMELAALRRKLRKHQLIIPKEHKDS